MIPPFCFVMIICCNQSLFYRPSMHDYNYFIDYFCGYFCLRWHSAFTRSTRFPVTIVHLFGRSSYYKKLCSLSCFSVICGIYFLNLVIWLKLCFYVRDKFESWCFILMLIFEFLIQMNPWCKDWMLLKLHIIQIFGNFVVKYSFLVNILCRRN